MKRYTFVAVLIALALMGCRSLTNPILHMKPDYAALPADALREVALEIERAVQDGNSNATIADRGGIVVNTEAVLHAIHTRAIRASLVNELRNSGNAWEKRSGHLYILKSKDYKKTTTPRQRDRDALVLDGEAQNRWTLYEGILKASNLPPRALSAIQETFFNARLELMPNGQKYEDESGNVQIKGR